MVGRIIALKGTSQRAEITDDFGLRRVSRCIDAPIDICKN
jgi:hypothetical protein